MTMIKDLPTPDEFIWLSTGERDRIYQEAYTLAHNGKEMEKDLLLELKDAEYEIKQLNMEMGDLYASERF